MSSLEDLYNQDFEDYYDDMDNDHKDLQDNKRRGKEFLVTASFRLVLKQSLAKWGTTVEELAEVIQEDVEYVKSLLNKIETATITKDTVGKINEFLEITLPEVDPKVKKSKMEDYLIGKTGI